MTPPSTQHPALQLDRRRFLGAVAGVAGLAAAAQLPVGPATATPRPADGGYPFTLGVASGDPTASGMVLWTRLVPDLFVPGGGMPPTKVPVQWQVATDASFRHIVRQGTTWALPSLAHSVHVEVDGLAPSGTCWRATSWSGGWTTTARRATCCGTTRGTASLQPGSG